MCLFYISPGRGRANWQNPRIFRSKEMTIDSRKMKDTNTKFEPNTELFREIFNRDTRPIAIINSSSPRILVGRNEAFVAAFGPELSFPGSEIPQPELPGEENPLALAFRAASAESEIDLRSAGGATRRYSVRAIDCEGQTALIFEDVTDARTLSETLEVFQKAIREYPGGVIWTDENNRVVFANDTVLNYSEMSEDEMVGINPDDFKNALITGEEPHAVNTKYFADFTSKSGAKVPVEVDRIHYSKPDAFSYRLPFGPGSKRYAATIAGAKALNIYFFRNASEFVARGDALARSREQNESLLRNLQGIAYRCSHTGNCGIEWMSEGALGLTGYRPEEFIVEGSIEYNSLIHKDDLAGVQAKFDECFVSKQPFNAEYRIITRDGQQKWVLERSKPIISHDGQITGIEGFIIDITEKKEHEGRILLSNRLYQMLSNTNQAVVRIRDKAELFGEICRIACDDGQYSGAFIALLDEFTDDVNLEAYATKSNCKWEKFALTMNDLHDVLFEKDKFYTANSASQFSPNNPLREFLLENGFGSFAAFQVTMFDHVVGVFAVANQGDYEFCQDELKLLHELAIDVSFALEFLIIEEERQNVATELHSVAEMFKVVTEHTGHLIFDFDVLSDKVAWSGAIKSVTGYEPHEFFIFTIKDWFSMIHPDDQENVRAELKKATDNKENYLITYRFRTKTGNYIYAEDIGTFEYDENGLAIRMLGVIKDVTKRKLMEIKFQESEQRLRTLINSTPDIICFKDGEGRWLAANDADIELFQLKGVDYVGKTDFDLAEFTHPMYRDAFLGCVESDNRTWESGTATQTEETIPISETDAKVYDVIKVPVYNEDGSRKGLVVLGRDITRRKKAETKLNYQTEFLNKVIENLPIGLYARDAANEYEHTIWNAKIEKMFGMEREMVLGKNLSKLITPAMAELYTDSDRAVMLGGSPVDLPYEIINFGSGRFECHTIKVPIYKPNGEPDTILGIVEDISERLKAQKIQELVYSIAKASIVTKDTGELYRIIQAELSEIMDTTNFFIALYNKDAHTLSLQYMQDQKDHFDVFPAGKTISAIVIGRKESLLLKTADMVKLEEDGLVDSVGSMSACWLGVPLLLNGEAIGLIVVQSYEDENAYNDEHKRILEFISSQVAISITKKRAEDELFALNMELEERVAERTKQVEDAMIELKYENEERRRTQEELYEAKNELSIALTKEIELNELKNRFISMVSHEYRTPLTVILSSSYLIEAAFKKQDAGVFAKYTNLIQSSVANMTKLLEDVLFMGKVYSGKLNSTFNQFNLSDLLATIIEEIRAIDRGEHTISHLSQQEKSFIDADEKLIHQIVLNLLSNACKYSPSGSEIIVESFERDDDICIAVADSGIGIPQDELDKLFEPFHRLTNVGTIPGTGLGLSIVKNCVDALGGEIKVDSRMDEGTRFVVILPRASGE